MKTSNTINPSPRQGWNDAFKEFAASGAEESFFPDFFIDEDLSDWTWNEELKKTSYFAGYEG